MMLPLATLLGVYLNIRRRAPWWRYAALLTGCALLMLGVWIDEAWAIELEVAGLVLVIVGRPRFAIARSAPRPATPGVTCMHIALQRPGFFLGDAQVVLRLDGVAVYSGGFRAGIDVAIPAAAGRHVLEATLEIPMLKRTRSWDVIVADPGCQVTLEYSRFWGNFAKKVRVEPLLAAA
jgi:hypothetical protein